MSYCYDCGAAIYDNDDAQVCTDCGGRNLPVAPVRKRRLRFAWTCSNLVHHEHRWYWSAWLCGRWQRLRHSLTGPGDPNG